MIFFSLLFSHFLLFLLIHGRASAQPPATARLFSSHSTKVNRSLLGPRWRWLRELAGAVVVVVVVDSFSLPPPSLFQPLPSREFLFLASLTTPKGLGALSFGPGCLSDVPWELNRPEKEAPRRRGEEEAGARGWRERERARERRTTKKNSLLSSSLLISRCPTLHTTSNRNFIHEGERG